jgi:ATP-dependent Clp protease ATP-binding subunit ClpC
MFTFIELKKICDIHYPAVVLESLATRNLRRRIRYVLGSLLLIGIILSISPTVPMIATLVYSWIYIVRGITSLFFLLWLSMFLLEIFFNSYYFDEKDIDFEVSFLAYTAPLEDVTQGFLNSWIGRYVMLRLGIGIKEIKTFLNKRNHPLSDNYIDIYPKDKDKITVADYVLALYDHDSELAKFLSDHGAYKKHLELAIEWIVELRRKTNEASRWWSKGALSKIPSVGRSWFYGDTQHLDSSAHPASEDPEYQALIENWRIYERNAKKIENILMKSSGEEIMVVAENIKEAIRPVLAFAYMVNLGIMRDELEGKRIMILHQDEFLKETSDSNDLEERLFLVFNEVNKSGNIILVIPDLPDFILTGKMLGINISAILEKILATTRVSVIVCSEYNKYYESIEPNRSLMAYFDVVNIDSIDDGTALRILEDEVFYLEEEYKVFFTFQALIVLLEAVRHLYSEESFADKAVTLLREGTEILSSKKIVLIDDKSMKSFLVEKTKISDSFLDKERENLIHLEENLQSKIIGQEEAINTLAEALRRARATLNNPKRPISSFLFLGPTGVGKTETAKALSESFFGRGDNFIRLDMSEYNTKDSIDRLIGNSLGVEGVLVKSIKERKFNLLLLDEFEKTSHIVQNLFLKILDEGSCSDGQGRKIDFRNVIIIATSNAGSDKILELSEKKENINRDDLIQYVIEKSIFSSEILNRFDDVIIFKSLNSKQAKKITNLMLEKMNKNLMSKGVEIEITDDLLEYLINKMGNKSFGARAINRAIQDEVQNKVAHALLDGKLKAGLVAEFKINSQNGELELNIKKRLTV